MNESMNEPDNEPAYLPSKLWLLAIAGAFFFWLATAPGLPHIVWQGLTEPSPLLRWLLD